MQTEADHDKGSAVSKQFFDVQLVDRASAARRTLSQDAEITKHWNVSLFSFPGSQPITVLCDAPLR